MTIESEAEQSPAQVPDGDGGAAAEEAKAGSELVVLFGDDLDEVSSARIGIRVAGGAKVSARDVATMLLATAIADLLERGIATLQESEVKKMFKTRKTLLLQGADVGDAGDSAGLTAAVASAAKAGVPLESLALRLLGERVATPEMALIAAAKSSLTRTGAVVEVKEKGLRRVTGKLGVSPFEIDDDGAETLRGRWQELKISWEAWRDRDPELAKRLLDGCRRSIAAAAETVD